MPMYNFIQNSSTYSDTTGNFILKMENDVANAIDFKSFEYKDKLLGNTDADEVDGTLRNATIFVPLKQLSNF